MSELPYPNSLATRVVFQQNGDMFHLPKEIDFIKSFVAEIMLDYRKVRVCA